MPTPAPVPQPRPLNAFGFSAALFWPQVFGGKSEKKSRKPKGQLCIGVLGWQPQQKHPAKSDGDAGDEGQVPLLTRHTWPPVSLLKSASYQPVVTGY